MKELKLCLVGFGNVGKSLARLLKRKTPELREHYGIEWRITGVATRRHGWLANPSGLDVDGLLAGQPVEHLPGPQGIEPWLSAARPDALFEISSLNPLDGQPAIAHCRAALTAGAHAITANKGTVVHGYQALSALASAKRKRFLFEATVIDGVPIFSLFRETLPTARLHSFRGILNATTNIILAEIEAGHNFAEGVRRAQEQGVAETDPSADLEGWDSTVKVAALAIVLMGAPSGLNWIERRGIEGLKEAEIRAAHAAGTPYKLICHAELTADGLKAAVAPERVPMSDPLALVSGSASAVRFVTDVLPGLTLTADSPGPETTAYGLLADLITAVRNEDGAGVR